MLISDVRRGRLRSRKGELEVVDDLIHHRIVRTAIRGMSIPPRLCPRTKILDASIPSVCLRKATAEMASSTVSSLTVNKEGEKSKS